MRSPCFYTDASGRTWTFGYHPDHGRLEWVDPPDTPPPSDADRTWFRYTAGRLTAIDRPLGWTMSIDYDEFERPWHVGYDGQTHTLEYDNLDRLVKLTYPDDTFREWGYEDLDVVYYRDRLNRYTFYGWDALRRLRTMEDTHIPPRTLQFGFGDCDGLESLTDARGKTTTWERDIQNRITRKIRHDLSESVFEYHHRSGWLERLTDPKGMKIDFAWSPDHRLIGRTYPNVGDATPPLSLVWDPYFPRIHSMADGAGLVTYNYHPPGQPDAGYLAEELRTSGGGAPLTRIAWLHDAAGRVRGYEINGQFEDTWAFDDQGRLDSNENALGLFDFTYWDPTERLKQILYPNGQEAYFSYKQGTATRRLDRIENHRPAPHSDLPTWFHDWNVEGELTLLGSLGAPWVVEPDGAGQLQKYHPAGLESAGWSYAYDPAGNRTSERPPGGIAAVATYDDLNQIQDVSTGFVPDRTFAHDLNGNLTLDQVTGGATTSYEWDTNDYLVAINRGLERTELSYDGLGRRIRIRELSGGIPQSDRRYLWCGDAICAQLDGATWTPTRLFLAEGETDPLGLAQRYYVRDHLGSVRYMTDASAQVVTSYEYDPWGRATRLAGTEDSAFGYAGYFTHRPTGLDLTWFRAYDPTIGRWLSRDPIGEFANGIGGATVANLYAYVGDAPLRYWDPFGLYCRTASYAERVKRNFVATNLAIPGVAAPTGMGSLTARALAAETHSITFLQWLRRGFGAVRMGASVHTATETGMIVGTLQLVNAALVTTAYELGVGIGSAVAAAPAGDGRTVGQWLFDNPVECECEN